MTEIIIHIFAISIFHKKVCISFWHWINLWDMGYYIEAIYRSALPLGSSKNLAWVPSYDVINIAGSSLFYSYKPVLYALWPHRRYTMQIVPFRVKLTAYGIRRNNDLCFSVLLQEIS